MQLTQYLREEFRIVELRVRQYRSHHPQIAPGTHTFDAQCTGQSSGEWLSSTLYWNSVSLTVSAVPTLQVACSANPTSAVAPLDVSFSTTVSGGLEPYEYSWTFGDGSTSTYANPMHTYASAGTFAVTVVVTDTETTAQVKSATATITVTAQSGDGNGGGGGGDTNANALDSMIVVGIVGGIIAVVIVVVVVVLISMGRKKNSGGQGSMPPSQQTGPPQNP